MTPADRPGPGETLAVGGALPGVMGWPVPYGGLRGRGSAWLQCLPSRPKVKKLDHGPDAVRVRAGVGAGDSDFHRTMRPDQDANRIIGNFADFSTVCVQNEKIILHISGQNLNLF